MLNSFAISKKVHGLSTRPEVLYVIKMRLQLLLRAVSSEVTYTLAILQTIRLTLETGNTTKVTLVMFGMSNPHLKTTSGAR
jgi:hypothetical protein